VNTLLVCSTAAGGSALFAGTEGGGVSLLTHFGWTPMNTGLTNHDVISLAVSYTNAGDTILFAGTDGGGIFRSTNNGLNWALADTGLINPTVLSLAVSPNGAGGNYVFAGTGGNGLFRSTNGGASWDSVNTGLTNTFARYVLALAVAPDSSGNIYAGTLNGVYRSADNGTNWVPMSIGLTNLLVRALAITPDGEGGINIFAGTLGGGVFLSTHYGTTSWVSRNIGLTSKQVTSLASTPFSVGAGTVNLFAGTSLGGVFVADATPLPVELSAFSAQVEGGAVNLRWHTATEVSNYGFEVERMSMNNEQLTINKWAVEGFVEGAGTSNVPKEYSFAEKNLAPGKYRYRLKQIDRDGAFKYSQEVEVNFASVPRKFSLEQNYPNPFNPTTNLQFTIGDLRFVELKIFDLLGREVRTLVSEERTAGSYSVKWDASNLPSGTYIYRLKAGSFTETKKMILMK